MPYKNPDHKRLWRKIYGPVYKQRPEVKAREAARMRRIRAERHEELLSRRRELYAQNPDKYYGYHKRWMQKNADHVNHYVRERDRRKLSSGKIELEEWHALCEKYGNRCLCCGSMEEITMDHVIPLIKSGLNIIENVQPLCRPCNSRKHDKIIDYRPQEVAA